MTVGIMTARWLDGDHRPLRALLQRVDGPDGFDAIVRVLNKTIAIAYDVRRCAPAPSV